MTRKHVDPITAEIVGNAMQSIAEEMGVALVRSAYSTNIKERQDCSCALLAPDGGLIALAEHIPVHLGSMQGLMGQIAGQLDDWDLAPGDVIVANDPYQGGGSHLPDVTLVRPVFFQGRLVAFVANIAHWSDVGGSSPGAGTAGSATEIFQEGLRIPPTRVYHRGALREDVLRLILVNMRDRAERLGDFRAQVASLSLGERRLQEVLDRYGADTVAAAVQELFAYSERRLRAALREVPEGTYRFTDAMDDDGISENPLPVQVAVSVAHGGRPSITFDFEGTASQAAGGINMAWPALLATVYYAVKAIVAPDVPPNAGFQRAIHVRAPEGSLVNSREPAAVGGRTDTCQRVVDAILGAMSQAVPERVVAASNGATTAIIFGGTQQLTGREFAYVEALGGGMGARTCKDGADGVQVHITNTSNLPVEAMEMEYPLRVLRYGLVPDSGGAGKFRGGLAIRKDIQALAPVLFSAHSDRHRIPPWGLMGGLPGACGQFVLNPGTPYERTVLEAIGRELERRNWREEGFAIMHSGGGTLSPQEAVERPHTLVESGPAAGLIAAAHMARALSLERVIGFDMGGTTAKAGLILGGQPGYTTEYEVGGDFHHGWRVRGSGYPVRFPMIDVAECGAGAGSIAWVDQGGHLRVGPESAGANPGPACYGKGGDQPTVTDAQVVLGRLDPDAFLGGEMRLKPDLAAQAILEKVARPLGMSLEEAAWGIVAIANANMLRILRVVSVARGHGPRDFTLLAYGGAGPLHATELAEAMSIGRVIVPRLPGLFSSLGLLYADMSVDFVETVMLPLEPESLPTLNAMMDRFLQKAEAWFARAQVPAEFRALHASADLRYHRQNYELRLPLPGSRLGPEDIPELQARFHEAHAATYGHAAPEEKVQVVNLRLQVVRHLPKPRLRPAEQAKEPSPLPLRSNVPVWFEGGPFPTRMYERSHLCAGHRIHGPAVVQEKEATTVVGPGWIVEVDRFGNLVLQK